MKKAVIFCLFCMVALTSCVKSIKSVKITDISLQRIEIDDSLQSGKVLYMLSSHYETHDWHLKFIYPDPPRYGSYEPIHGMTVKDADGMEMNDSFLPLDSCLGRECVNATLSVANDTSATVMVNFHTGLDEIVDELRSCAIRTKVPKLLYADAEHPLPDSVILHFQQRDLKAKVNNVPVKYHVKNILQKARNSYYQER